MAKSQAVSPESNERSDLLILGGVAVIGLGIFGKFALDFANIAKERKRGNPWTYDPRHTSSFDYHPPEPPKSPPS